MGAKKEILAENQNFLRENKFEGLAGHRSP